LKTADYILPLVAVFKMHADTANAIQMKKYMKDKFVFFGIHSPLRKEIYKAHKNQHGLIPEKQTMEIVRWCWQAPEREYQYFAMEFLGKKQKRVQPDMIGLYEYMITTKSWWDTVDFIAANLVGSYFKQYPDRIKSLTEEWLNSGNIWLQRTCLLFQLKYKTETNTKLLESFIYRLSPSNEFFIRKAIGWALREYSKTDADFVVQFVKTHALSGLSEREALKWYRDKGVLH
jgi:3-methyladenine DNA glycosylase AlkD